MNEDEMDDVERMRKVRRDLEREFRTLERLSAFVRKKEKNRTKNIASAKQLLRRQRAQKGKSGTVMNGKQAKVFPDGAEVKRIRKVRRRLERKFKTVDAMFDHFVEMDKKRRAKASAKRSKNPAPEGQKRAS